MMILAFDTSNQTCSIALRHNDAILAYYYDADQQTGRDDLVERIKTILEQGQCTWDQIDRIALTLGPGSFTGLRIGLSVARTLKGISHIPVVTLTSLEAIAANFLTPNTPARYCINQPLRVIIPAASGYAYSQAFHQDWTANNKSSDKIKAPVTDDQPRLYQLSKMTNICRATYTIIASRQASTHIDDLLAKLDPSQYFYPYSFTSSNQKHLASPDARLFSLLAQQRQPAADLDTLRPLYIKPHYADSKPSIPTS